MTKENRIIEKTDLVTSDIYAKNRKQIRKKLVTFKKNRRVSLGPHATFYFENFETMLGQVQEMLHIEKGGSEQLKDELSAYNPLIPKGKELIATLMFEIDDPNLRSSFLGKVGGIEERVYIQVKKEIVKANPEKDVDRTSTEGKASSVQFIHFNFSKDQIIEFKNINTEIILGIDHVLYNHMIKIPNEVQKSLMMDFI
tara:strand:+ start:109 stop:702 length:594 start_codon:yes stop_codon:yes gene_type:complete